MATARIIAAICSVSILQVAVMLGTHLSWKVAPSLHPTLLRQPYELVTELDARVPFKKMRRLRGSNGPLTFHAVRNEVFYTERDQMLTNKKCRWLLCS
jgi:hypothetical protein